VALYNTALGLVIAVPAMIFYRHFRAKVESFLVEMEQQASKLVDLVHGERFDFADKQQVAAAAPGKA
jgi:biopolymer transport protein ExbB